MYELYIMLIAAGIGQMQCEPTHEPNMTLIPSCQCSSWQCALNVATIAKKNRRLGISPDVDYEGH